MPIIHITGPAKSGKSLLGNGLRNQAIGRSTPAVLDESGAEIEPAKIYGALLVDDSQSGEPRYLLEKLMAGGHLGADPKVAGEGPAVPRPATAIEWKLEPLVIFVGAKIALLAEFEALAPGFTEMFGPVRAMGLADA